MMKTNSLTITYLSKVSFASLNGADKEVDNINPIKKIRLNNGEELPYLSSQAVRRALRDKLEELGFALSPVEASSTDKGAPKTALNPKEYIDDDLFGYMNAQAGKGTDAGFSNVRTSPVRVESLLALATYKGDLDYATNFMGKKINLNANIFETEIHSGVYRGSILIELDRVGKEFTIKDDKTNEVNHEDLVENSEKSRRVCAFLDALQTMWTSGRQTRFLSDISPKFMVAAIMKSKNPIFMESVTLNEEGEVDLDKINSVADDYDRFIDKHVLGVQEGVFKKQSDMMKSMKDAFQEVKNWIEGYYNVK